MKFADFVSSGAIRAELEADDKEGTIREMAAALVEAGDISEEALESIVQAILKREELGSTGIGRGIAVPHTKLTRTRLRPSDDVDVISSTPGTVATISSIIWVTSRSMTSGLAPS